MYDIIIIGKGPAGISAALYAVRAGMKATIIGSGTSAIEKAKIIENYYGTGEPINGAELHSKALAQIKAFGVEIIEAEVTGIEMTEFFCVTTSLGNFDCRAAIIAVGKPRTKPSVNGCDDFEGKGVSYCAICDGFFFRGKKLGVLGSGNYALHEATQLLAFSKDVTIYTNGADFTAGSPAPCNVSNQKIESVFGDAKLGGLVLSCGESVPLDGLFIAQGTADALSFARKLGITIENGSIAVDKNGMTACKGIFAAGDCIGGLNQLSTAVGEGALAGQRAAEYVREALINSRKIQ